MRKGLSVVLIVLAATLGLGVPALSENKPADKVKVCVGIPPIAYFVEKVAGPNVEVSVLVGPGKDPHTFEPSPKLLAGLAETQVIFKSGFPFEESLIKKLAATLKSVEVVDIQQGIKLRAVTEDEADDHGHDHGKKHKHGHSHEAGEMDPHTWLDPGLAKVQARTIAETLIRTDPSRKEEYERNLKSFHADLDAIHQQLAKVLEPLKGKSFFVFHPAYGYFGDAYGLKQIPVQIGGKEPTARQLARLMASAKKAGVKVIFVQPQFSRKSAETLAKAIGGAVVILDDLAPDYLGNLRDMADKLDAALRTPKK